MPSEAPARYVDWDGWGRGGPTLVILRVAEILVAIFGALVDAGRDVDTPVACVMDGGLPGQKVVLTTLAAIVSSGPPPELRSPAVTVIGAVAGFAAG